MLLTRTLRPRADSPAAEPITRNSARTAGSYRSSPPTRSQPEPLGRIAAESACDTDFPSLLANIDPPDLYDSNMRSLDLTPDSPTSANQDISTSAEGVADPDQGCASGSWRRNSKYCIDSQLGEQGRQANVEARAYRRPLRIKSVSTPNPGCHYCIIGLKAASGMGGGPSLGLLALMFEAL